MKVYVNRQPIRTAWGGGTRFVNALYDIGPSFNLQFVGPNETPDVIFVAGIDRDANNPSLHELVSYKQYYERATAGKSVKLVLRVNENDARKNTSHVDDYLLKAAPYVDSTIFVSHWLKDYFVNKGWQTANTSVIYNGVDSTVFSPQPKIDNGKINVVCAHWSDNAMKGQWLNEAMDEFVSNHSDEYSFTFIGRTKATFKHSTHIQPLAERELGKQLGKFDLCVNASVADPGPNAVIESISCGLPTYVHELGGGGAEFAGASHIYKDWSTLESILLTKKFEKNTTTFGDWNRCIECFINQIR